jgi:hypothetical protein
MIFDADWKNRYKAADVLPLMDRSGVYHRIYADD